MKKYVLSLLALVCASCTDLLAQRVVPLENSATHEGLEAIMKKESVYLQDQGNLLPKYEGQWTGSYAGHKIQAKVSLQRKHQAEAIDESSLALYADRLIFSYQVQDGSGKLILDTDKAPLFLGEGNALEVVREGGKATAKILEEHYEFTLPLDDRGTCIFVKATLSPDLKTMTLRVSDAVIADDAGDCPDFVPGTEDSWVLTRTSPVPTTR